MTLRRFDRTRRSLVLGTLGLGSLALAGGCDPRALAYFLQPNESSIDAPGPSLKGKKVVILCHATTGTMADFPDLENELCKGLGRSLGASVKKIQVVPHQKIKIWADSHPGYTDPAEVGVEYEADAVIFLEVESIQLEDSRSPGLFQGSSRIYVKLFDLLDPTDDKGKPIPGRDKEITVAYDEVVETAFPRTQGAMPISATVNRSNFRKKFLEVVVAELAWQFTPRGTGDMIQDTDI